MKLTRILPALILSLAFLALTGCQQGGESVAWSQDETGTLVTPAPGGPAPALAMGERWITDETGLISSPRPSLAERVDTSLFATSEWSVDETGMLSTPRVVEAPPENIIEVWPAD